MKRRKEDLNLVLHAIALFSLFFLFYFNSSSHILKRNSVKGQWLVGHRDG